MRDKLYLVGFMAAGKTSAARLLGARLGWRVEDVDELVEARERLSIADIFARFGEPYFRAAERDILKLLFPLRKTVVATGGGTFVDMENRTAMNLDGVSIWIDAPFPDIVRRLPADGSRPLAADVSQLERLYHLRCAAYQHAHVRVDAAGISTELVVERILAALGSLG